MKKARKLYESPSGDRWYLIADPSGAVFIHHEANLASGGQVDMRHRGLPELRRGSGAAGTAAPDRVPHRGAPRRPHVTHSMRAGFNWWP